MKTPLNQKGASHIVAVLAVVVIAAVGVIGYQVMQANSDSTTDTASNNSSSESANTSGKAKIQSRADVQQASSDLDNTSLNDVDPSQLDADLNSIL